MANRANGYAIRKTDGSFDIRFGVTLKELLRPMDRFGRGLPIDYRVANLYHVSALYEGLGKFSDIKIGKKVYK